MKPKEAELKQPAWWPFYILALLIVGSWLFWPRLLKFFSGLSPIAENGQFGDSFGALNTLFSGMAFAALGYTMWMQRSELAETREILRSQKEEAELQNSTLARQTFENTFFHLLRFQTELSADAEVNIHPHPQRRGRQSFTVLFEMAMSGFHNGQVTELNRGGFSDSYSLQRKNVDKVMVTYVRNIVGILEFIQVSEMSELTLYSNMLRNLLSNDEQKLLMICSVADLGDSTRLLELSKEFKLFEHIDMSDHTELMLLQAYKSS